MFGIEAINAHNGWSMAIAGALIVVSGLSILSLIISQLHKVLALLEKREKSDRNAESSTPAPSVAATVDHDLSNLEDSLSCYCSETTKLGSAFTLQDLFAVFQECDFPHPHLTIRSLKEEGLLVPTGEGMFSWRE